MVIDPWESWLLIDASGTGSDMSFADTMTFASYANISGPILTKARSSTKTIAEVTVSVPSRTSTFWFSRSEDTTATLL